MFIFGKNIFRSAIVLSLQLSRTRSPTRPFFPLQESKRERPRRFSRRRLTLTFHPRTHSSRGASATPNRKSRRTRAARETFRPIDQEIEAALVRSGAGARPYGDYPRLFITLLGENARRGSGTRRVFAYSSNWTEPRPKIVKARADRCHKSGPGFRAVYTHLRASPGARDPGGSESEPGERAGESGERKRGK